MSRVLTEHEEEYSSCDEIHSRETDNREGNGMTCSWFLLSFEVILGMSLRKNWYVKREENQKKTISIDDDTDVGENTH